MTIKTFYYGLFADGSGGIFQIPVIIKDRQLMPNHADKTLTFIDDYKVSMKTDYTVTWLDKYDTDKRGRDVFITFFRNSYDGALRFHLRLNWWQKIKLKIIWDKYWLFRGDNFRNYIFPVIIGVISALITTFIKDIVTKDNNKGTDNTYEQPVK